MKKLTALFLGAAVLPFLSGCISNPTPVSSVGPEPSAQASAHATGRLRVFSATQTRAGENTSADYSGYFYPHSSYEIKNNAGDTVKYVRNRAVYMDQSPDSVKLPPGRYNVVAESTWCGLVKVPVVIEAGKTTVVHLDANWNPPLKTASEKVVKLPDGEAAGWASAEAKQ